MRRIFLGQLLFAIATTLSTPALAQTMTVYFTGVVDTVFDQLNRTNTAPGMYFRGWYSFDAGTPDGDGNPAVGRYAHENFGVTVGTVTVMAGNGEINVANGHPDEFDVYRVRGDGLAFCGPNDRIVIRLVDLTRSAVENDALPPGFPDISRFNTKDFLLDFRCDFGGDIRIAGTITAITNTNSPNEFLWNMASDLTRLIQVKPGIDDFDLHNYHLWMCEPVSPERVGGTYCTLKPTLEGLLDMVAKALGAAKKNDEAVARNTLEKFRKEVASLIGKSLTEDEAKSLISQADAAIGFVGPDHFRFR